MKRSRSELEVYNASLLTYAQKQTKYLNKLLSWECFPGSCDVCIECGEVLMHAIIEVKRCVQCHRLTCLNCVCTCWRNDMCIYPYCNNIIVRHDFCVFHTEYPREKKYHWNSPIGSWCSWGRVERVRSWSVFTHVKYSSQAHEFVMFLLLLLRKFIPRVKDMQKYIIGIIMTEYDAIEIDIYRHARKSLK